MKQQAFILLLLSILLLEVSFSQSTIIPKRSFVYNFKNQINNTAKYDTWYACGNSNDYKDNSVIHSRGSDTQIGLRIVFSLQMWELVSKKQSTNFE